MDIIIKKGSPSGRTRSKTERRLIKEWGSSGLTEEKIDKAEFLERVAKEQLGMDKVFVNQSEIDKVE